MVLGDAVSKLDVCIDFEPYFKVHNLVSVHPISIILGQMANLNMVFHVVVSVYRLVKIWNSPQFLPEFRNGQLLNNLCNCRFSRAQQKFHVFPRLSPARCFPALETGYLFSRACHWLHDFPRLSPVTCFPVLVTDYMISHARHRLHVFPRLTVVHVFPRLWPVT